MAILDYVLKAKAAWDAAGGEDAAAARREEHRRLMAGEQRVYPADMFVNIARLELPERPRQVAEGLQPSGYSTISRWVRNAIRSPGWLGGDAMLLTGPAGIGKTVSACLVGLARARDRGVVRYASTYAEPMTEARREKVRAADLLILDESARALEQGAWVQGAWKEILNERYDSKRNTLIIFTGALRAFAEGYGPEMLDRIPPSARYVPDATDEKSRRWTP